MRAPRGLVVGVGPGRAVDVVAGGQRQLGRQRGGGRQRRDRREPRVGSVRARQPQRRRARGRAQAQRLVAERVARRVERHHQVPAVEAEHRRRRALARLDALGRDARDLLEHQRQLERRRPRGAAADGDRRGRRVRARPSAPAAHASASATARAAASGAPATTRAELARRPSAPPTARARARTRPPAPACASPPRCDADVLQHASRRPRRRATSRRSAVIATHGPPARARAISTTSRNSPDEDTASTASPGRQRKPPRATIPHGTRDDRRTRRLALERREPQRVRDVVRGAVAGRDDPLDAAGAQQLGGLARPRRRRPPWRPERSGSSRTSAHSPVSRKRHGPERTMTNQKGPNGLTCEPQRWNSRPGMPLSQASQPLYHRVYREIAKEIESGALQPGDRLPSERWLCDELGVSRATVRRAIEELVADGLVESRGRGSFVTGDALRRAAQHADEPVRARPLARPRRPARACSRPRSGRRRSTRPRRSASRPAPSCSSSSALRMLDGLPISLDHNRVPLRLAPEPTDLDFTHRLAVRGARARAAIRRARADYELEARGADAPEAELLGLAPGAPVLFATTVAIGERRPGRRPGPHGVPRRPLPVPGDADAPHAEGEGEQQ